MFKKESAKAEAVLKAAGFKVSINADRPRKGAFVITLSSSAAGKAAAREVVIVNLLDMPRPFKKLREADVEALTRAGIESFGK